MVDESEKEVEVAPKATTEDSGENAVVDAADAVDASRSGAGVSHLDKALLGGSGSGS